MATLVSCASDKDASPTAPSDTTDSTTNNPTNTQKPSTVDPAAVCAEARDLIASGNYAEALKLLRTAEGNPAVDRLLSHFYNTAVSANTYYNGTLIGSSELVFNELHLPAGRTTSFSQDNYGGERSQVIAFTYDELGRPSSGVSQRSEFGETIESIYAYTYDENNHLVCEIEVCGEDTVTRNYSYDESGNLLRSEEMRSENDIYVQEYVYDAQEYLLTSVAKQNEVEQWRQEYSYDANGNCTSILYFGIDGDSSSSTFVYENGILLKETYTSAYGEGIVHEYIYDGNGKLLKALYTSYGITATEDYSYDANGNLVRVVFDNPEGFSDITDFFYGANGTVNRIVSNYSDGSSYDARYDDLGNELGYTETDAEGNVRAVEFVYQLIYLSWDVPQLLEEMLLYWQM